MRSHSHGTQGDLGHRVSLIPLFHKPGSALQRELRTCFFSLTSKFALICGDNYWRTDRGYRIVSFLQISSTSRKIQTFRVCYRNYYLQFHRLSSTYSSVSYIHWQLPPPPFESSPSASPSSHDTPCSSSYPPSVSPSLRSYYPSLAP